MPKSIMIKEAESIDALGFFYENKLMVVFVAIYISGEISVIIFSSN